MRHVLQRCVLGLAVLTCIGCNSPLLCAAETSKVGSATRQVEQGAKQAGRGIEQTVKGVGNTVVEGAKTAGDKIQEAGKEAKPHAENAWDKVKGGAEAAGRSVTNFLHKVFGN